MNIPFCRSKCTYCNFITYPLKFPVEEYFLALNKEIQNVSHFLENFVVDSIYIGGGTPSSVKKTYLKNLVDNIFKKFSVNKTCEFTIEVNPEDISEDFLKGILDLGVNRVSIGIQSLSKNILKKCGRIEFNLNYLFKIINKLGDTISFNFDFIIGLPGDSLFIWKNNISKISDLNLKHLSFYMLEVHERTKLFWDLKKERIKLPEENEVLEIFDFVSQYVENLGFMRYEISNFAKENYQSKHNLKYWNRENYVGFGNSAHSFLSPYKFSNSSNIRKYLKNIYEKGYDFSNIEKLSLKDEIFEYFMMGMRKVKGISIVEMRKKFGLDFYKILNDKINFFIEEKLLKKDNEMLSFTSEGFLISNYILSEILEVWEKICVE